MKKFRFPIKIHFSSRQTKDGPVENANRVWKAVPTCLCEWKLKNLCLRKCFHSKGLPQMRTALSVSTENTFSLNISCNFSFSRGPRLFWSIFWLNGAAGSGTESNETFNKHFGSVITDRLVVAAADCLCCSNRPSMIHKKYWRPHTQKPRSFINSSVLCRFLCRAPLSFPAACNLCTQWWKKFIIYRQKARKRKKNAIKSVGTHWVTSQ